MYFEKEPRRFRRRELLTCDEAQRIAAVFAKLPELLGRLPQNKLMGTCLSSVNPTDDGCRREG